MNIRGVPAIEHFSETVALLGLTTDLQGRAAADAIGLIIANTDALASEAGRIGAVLTALGNQFRGGEVAIIDIAEDIARSTAEFNLSAASVLAFSAVFAQSGARAEKTGTVFQRAIRALVDAASEAASGSPEKLVAVADAAGVSFERLSDVIIAGDFTTGLRILGDALANLENIGSDRELSRGNLLTLLFGGERPPVRIAEILGVFAKNAREVDRALALANEEWERQIALLEEAGKFAEANALRLQVVTNQIMSQGRAVGEGLTSVFVPLAENFKALELAAIGIGTALATRFGARTLGRIRATNAELRGAFQLEAQVALAQSQRTAREAAAAQAALTASSTRGVARLREAETAAAANLAASRAVRQHTIAQRNLARGHDGRGTCRTGRRRGACFLRRPARAHHDRAHRRGHGVAVVREPGQRGCGQDGRF